jgi:hypothetical protein
MQVRRVTFDVAWMFVGTSLAWVAVACGSRTGLEASAVDAAPPATDAAAPARDATVEASAPDDAGDGGPFDAPITERPDAPFDAGTLTDAGVVVAVATGISTSCALRANGLVQCWGGYWDGELGDGQIGGTIGGGASPPVVVSGIHTATAISQGGPVPGLTGVIAISGTQYQVCALTASGDVYCWGTNYYDDYRAPVRVPL